MVQSPGEVSVDPIGCADESQQPTRSLRVFAAYQQPHKDRYQAKPDERDEVWDRKHGPTVSADPHYSEANPVEFVVLERHDNGIALCVWKLDPMEWADDGDDARRTRR